MTAARARAKKGSARRIPRPAWLAAGLFAALAAAGFLAGRRLGQAPGSGPYREEIARWCAAYNVNADLAAAVLETESAGRPRAVSSAGALGLMQLMPRTAEWLAGQLGLGELSREDLFRPETNIRLGVYYLSALRRQFGDERPFVIAAYHAGPTRVERWRRRRADLSAEEVIAELAFPETRVYVRRVTERWKALARRGRGGRAPARGAGGGAP
jgi:soluble lytic murein transglycosylase